MLHAGLISLKFSGFINFYSYEDQEKYFAQSADSIKHFENVEFSKPKQCNPGDVFMDIISRQGERYAKTGFKESHMTIPALVDRWNLQRKRCILYWKTLSITFWLALSALHFKSLYSALIILRMPFKILLAVDTLHFYCSYFEHSPACIVANHICIYGLASCASITTSPKIGPLMAMIVSLIPGGFGEYDPPLSTIRQWHLEW
ncbi:hypothetical protein EAF00_006870 [Botryotinia globosa]|nr:hypothetical protein EAF00_006870 [Botryotinia globosa]